MRNRSILIRTRIRLLNDHYTDGSCYRDEKDFQPIFGALQYTWIYTGVQQYSVQCTVYRPLCCGRRGLVRRRCIPDTSAQEGGSGGSEKGGREGVGRGVGREWEYSYLKLFPGVWYPAELCSAGSDTPKNFVRRSIRPRRMLFCGVSDLTGKLRPRRIRRKSFESLPFSLKGHFSKIICMYKVHYQRLIVSMLKEPPILKMFFCSVGYDTPRNHFRIRISRRIQNGNQKYCGAWIRGPYEVDSWKKPEAKNLVLLYL